MRWIACLVLVTLAFGCKSRQRWRETEPVVANELTYRPPESAKHWLDNGVGVFVSPLRHPATTRVALVFGHGYLDDRKEPGHSRLFAKWLELEALGEKAAPFDALGATVNTRVMTMATVIEVDVLHQDTQAAVGALASLVQGAADEAAFELARSKMLSALRAARRNPETLASLAALKSAVRGGPPEFGRRGLGSVESLRGAHFEDMLAIRDRWIANVPVSVAVVGPHEPAEVTGWARNILSRWSRRRPREAIANGFARRPKVITVVPMDNLEPAVVLVATTTPRSSAAALDAYRVGRSVAHYRLREDQQRTYGVGGDLADLGFAGFAFASARVPTGNAYSSALTIAAAFGRSIRRVNDDAVKGLHRSSVATWTASKIETEPRARALYRAIAFGYDLRAQPPFGPIPGPSTVDEVKNSLANDFSYVGMQIVLVGNLQALSHQLRGTTFEVRTDLDLLGPSP